MEAQVELNMLENEYKNSVKNYRNLIRGGMDEALEIPGEIAQELISKTRDLLDNKSPEDAKETLIKLSSHLKTMRNSFPQAKSHILNELQASIAFIEEIAHNPHSVGQVTASLEQDLHTQLEQVRFAAQNEDWTAAKRKLGQAVDHYLNKQQQRIRRTRQASVIPASQNTLIQLQEKGAHCRAIKLADIEKLFKLASQRHTTAVGFGVIASPEHISKLFSDLSQTQVNMGDDQDHAAVIRLSIDRTTTVYIIGLSVNSSTEVNSIRGVLNYLNAVFFSPDRNTLTNSMCEKLLISTLENVADDKVCIAGDHSLSFSAGVSQFTKELTSATFFNWLNKVIS